MTTGNECQKCHDKSCLECPEYYGRCVKCKDGYRIALTSCFKCFDDNCKKCNEMHMNCEECLAGYELRDKKCFKEKNNDELWYY